jgi:hypothetical protein
MAGGPLFPFSAYPSSGAAFPWWYVGAGSTGPKQIDSLGVGASLAADAVWTLVFWLPAAIPSGTAKLRLRAMASATSGNAKVNPSWGIISVGDDASSATLSAEGTATLTWGAGDTDDVKEIDITLDASTIDSSSVGKWIGMRITFETASWTLAVISGWVATIVWV